MGAKISLKAKMQKMEAHKKKREKEKILRKLERNMAKNRRGHFNFA